MIRLYIRDFPYIAWILPSWIATKLPSAKTFVVPLTGIFLGNTDGIQIKVITVTFGKPKNRFVPTAEALPTVKTMPKCPHDSISETHLRQGPQDVKH
jgi:hypothetical protein